jgi:hypothetical protein
VPCAGDPQGQPRQRRRGDAAQPSVSSSACARAFSGPSACATTSSEQLARTLAVADLLELLGQLDLALQRRGRLDARGRVGKLEIARLARALRIRAPARRRTSRRADPVEGGGTPAGAARAGSGSAAGALSRSSETEPKSKSSGCSVLGAGRRLRAAAAVRRHRRQFRRLAQVQVEHGVAQAWRARPPWRLRPDPRRPRSASRRAEVCVRSPWACSRPAAASSPMRAGSGRPPGWYRLFCGSSDRPSSWALTHSSPSPRVAVYSRAARTSKPARVAALGVHLQQLGHDGQALGVGAHRLLRGSPRPAGRDRRRGRRRPRPPGRRRRWRRAGSASSPSRSPTGRPWTCRPACRRARRRCAAEEGVGLDAASRRRTSSRAPLPLRPRRPAHAPARRPEQQRQDGRPRRAAGTGCPRCSDSRKPGSAPAEPAGAAHRR